jgi:hypothetical protein
MDVKLGRHPLVGAGMSLVDRSGEIPTGRYDQGTRQGTLQHNADS